ncbi:MAG: bacteriohemerythrin [Rhodocyclales bacterium]|nr:bacteriohemerythrin [Rhodocyclales bacterium]
MLTTFKWNHYFETGLPDVDAQHRHLVGLLNQLGNEVDSSTPEHIDQTLTALADYTVYHFGCEERLMEQYGVAAEHQEVHRHAHQRFVAQVNNWLATRHEAGQLSLSQLVAYLANWLIFHILGDDQSLGRQITAIRRGETPAAAFAADRASEDPRTDILLDSLRRLYGGLLERNERLLHAYDDLKREHADLEHARDELAALNATLEQRVVERTDQLRAANERLREEQDRLIVSERAAAVGQLAAGFAHEINTPVGIAVGTVSQFQETVATIRRLLGAEEVREEELVAQLDLLDEATGMAMGNLRRAAGLVQAFKRSSIDQISEQAKTFRLRNVIEDDLLTLRGPIKQAGADIVVECPADLEIEGIPGLYDQLITNLTLNALQHGLAAGGPNGRIRIAASVDNDRLKLELADNGRGMTPDEAAHVFQPFFTTNRSKGGTGLGLYICHDIATHRLGGSIECETGPGKGTKFRIEVPIGPIVRAADSR